MSPAMNMQGGAEKADFIILDTLSAVQPPVEWVHDAATEISCNDFKNDATGTGSATRRAAVTTKVSAVRRGSLLGLVERHWKKRGYEITSVDADEELPVIYAATPDDFRMSLAVGHKGQFFLSVTTPCLGESAVLPPATKPNGPDYSGGPIPRPDVHDSFWSSPGGLSAGVGGTA
ncbi:hypothetical protein [Streptomyces sp. GMY02]|uniref:hypothetical protein n=1 Tax=Streptomyces sp. GMY02 TaxID=1333528 RepID=UPI0020B8502A|nr:hypothetical protein [Streptomyces sp. GMY02]